MTQISHHWLVFSRPLLHLFRHHNNPLPGSSVQESFMQQLQRSFSHKTHGLQLGLWQLWRGTTTFRICFKILFLLNRKVHPDSSYVDLLLRWKSTVLFHHRTLSPEYFPSNYKCNPTENSSSNHKHSKLTVPINRSFSGLDYRREMQILVYRSFILWVDCIKTTGRDLNNT